MELSEFASSSSGDRWFLDRGVGGWDFVLHRANAAAGASETRYGIERFLSLDPQGPEHAALRMLIADREPRNKS
jgi:hypothetical protein